MKKYLWFAAIGALLLVGAALWRVSGSRSMKDPRALAQIVHDPILVDADGSIDFVEMLNTRLKGDIRPEENAFVDYLNILGPGDASAIELDELSRWLEIDEIRSDMPFESMKSFTNGGALLEERDVWEQVLRRPWTDEEFPEAARWLEQNADHLVAIHLAAQKPTYFYPMVSLLEPGEKGWRMNSCSLEYAHGMGDLAKFLAIHAMHETARGDTQAAVKDLIAIHQIAAHVGCGMTVVENLSSIAIDGIAFDAAASLIGSGTPTAEQLAEYRNFLRDHPPDLQMSESISTADRWMALDAVQAVEIWGVDVLSDDVRAKSERPLIERKLTWSAVDWAAVATVVSESFDSVVEIYEQPNDIERMRQLTVYEQSLTQGMDDTLGWIRVFLSGATARGKAMGQILTCLLLPHAPVIAAAEVRNRMRREMLDAALAAAQYRLERERWPDGLNELVPKYLDAVPLDRFSQGPLVYRTNPNGFELISVGKDGQLDDVGPESSKDIHLVVGHSDDFILESSQPAPLKSSHE